MNPLYNSGISLYRMGAKLVSLRNRKAALMLDGQSRTFAHLAESLEPGRRYVWMHVASLGEFEQGRPLLEKLRREHPELGIVLTFFSPSGYEVRKNYPGADIICYLPFDTPGNARRWVETLRPVAAIFVKYEFWGNYLTALKRAGVPTYLISAIFRPGQSFFRWWGGMFRDMLGCFDRLFVQDEASRRLLEGIGVTNVEVAGDTRFDRVTDIMRSTRSIAGMDSFAAGRKCIVFGSSWEADEQLYIPWLRQHTDVCSIIAPHEFDSARLEALVKNLTVTPGDTMLLSQYEKHPDAKGLRCIIVDSFGKLSSLYRYGDVAYIGGGFGHGIHNINEAAVYGIPVVFGPRHAKFKEATDLIDCGGGFEVTDRDTLQEKFDRLVTDDEALARAGKAAGDYIARSIGATDRIYPSLNLSGN